MRIVSGVYLVLLVGWLGAWLFQQRTLQAGFTLLLLLLCVLFTLTLPVILLLGGRMSTQIRRQFWSVWTGSRDA